MVTDQTATTRPGDVVVLGGPGVRIDRDEAAALMGLDRPVSPLSLRSHDRDAELALDVDGDDDGFAVILVGGRGDEAVFLTDLRFRGDGPDWIVTDADGGTPSTLRSLLSSLRRTTSILAEDVGA